MCLLMVKKSKIDTFRKIHWIAPKLVPTQINHQLLNRTLNKILHAPNTALTEPYEVVEKEARTRDLTISEFLNRFQAIAEFDNFDGVHYTFEEIQAEVGGAKH